MKIFAIAGTFFQKSEQLDIHQLRETEGGTIAVITKESMSHAFSGHFQIRSNDHCHGLLLDAYGPAFLQGAMTDDKLSFEKVYQRTGNSVWYNYTKTAGGLWIGTYEGDHVPPGTTRCFLTELEASLFSLDPVVSDPPRVTYPG